MSSESRIWYFADDANAMLTGTTTTTTTTTSPTPSKPYQGVYLQSWVGGWTEEGIRNLFSPLHGRADVAYLSFFNITSSGIDCQGQSPCADIWVCGSYLNASRKFV
jgi:hypothetical protein